MEKTSTWLDPMIKSILDTDLYKFTMQWAIIKEYPDVVVEYAFNNRRLSNKFNLKALNEIKRQIKLMGKLGLTHREKTEFKKKCPFIPDAYLEWLSNYRFDPKEVTITLESVDADGWGDLKIHIKGLWCRTVLWEVPLMAIVSETYFRLIDTNWNMAGQLEQFYAKGEAFAVGGIQYSEFGTRRRRSFDTQDLAVKTLSKYEGFIGTSNVFLAIKYDCKAMGTVAHEWTMGQQVLGGIVRCNFYALTLWNKVYQGDLGIALTDTIGTDSFYKDFDPVLSRLYDGVRHDSGCPFQFIEKTVAHYNSVRINPLSKVALFSDGLNAETCFKIHDACKGKIIDRYGIGTWFSNDFCHIDGTESKALNIVIKIIRVNNRPVVKLSDVISKAIGEKDAIRTVKYLVNNIPLDA